MAQPREYFETFIRLQPSAKEKWRLYEDLEREYGSAKRVQLLYERFDETSKQVDERLVVGTLMARSGHRGKGGRKSPFDSTICTIRCLQRDLEPIAN